MGVTGQGRMAVLFIVSSLMLFHQLELNSKVQKFYIYKKWLSEPLNPLAIDLG